MSASDSPAAAGFSVPAEWSPHAAVWTAWPDHADWRSALPEARRELAELLRAIHDDGRGERVRVLVRGAELLDEARAALASAGAELELGPYGDLWLRDTGPVFLRGPGGALGAACFRFNGWGEKFRMPGDQASGAFVAGRTGAKVFRRELVLEGGAVDFDGEGTVLTTRQCLLNPNRNPHLDQAAIERELRESFGVEKVLWLQDGLLEDHTDGHVDTIARFVGPGRVLCMRPAGPADPNRQQLEAIRRDLEGMSDAQGRPLEVVTVSSPGAVTSEDGALLPASYANFYVANTRVVVPTYGSPHDDEVVEAMQGLVGGRAAVGAPARAILHGGGAFHCITQQQPVGGAEEPA